MRRKELTSAASEPREDGAIQVEMMLSVRQRRREGGQPGSASNPGDRLRIPRISRLMALAIKFQAMVERGEVRDYADIARLGYVTRARLTQIMNLLLLAPDIQADILGGAAPEYPSIAERHLRKLTLISAWGPQRLLWSELLARSIAQR